MHSSSLKQRTAENFVLLNIARHELADAMIETRNPTEFAELREIKSHRACNDLFKRRENSRGYYHKNEIQYTLQGKRNCRNERARNEKKKERV